MFKLVSNLLMLGFITLLITVIIIGITPLDTNNYMAAAIDKHHLLYSIKSPRIILVGGSNLIFSVDSEKIERRFGLPVINMGLNAALGLRFMLNEIKPAVKDGDIILIFPEYEHFSPEMLDGNPKELGAVIKFCPECISGLSTPSQISNTIIGFFQNAGGDILQIFKGPHQVYTRQGFNRWGDLVSHLDQPNKAISPTDKVLNIQTSSPRLTVELLNSFYQSANAVNAQVFLMFPAVPTGTYIAQKEDIIAIYDSLKTELKIPILGTPQEFVYPEEYFYDTVYHMNRTGQEQRTNHIIELLVPLLQNSKLKQTWNIPQEK